jgi:hypothetical protein
MDQAVLLRPDYDATQLRWIARESEDAAAQRRPKSVASPCKWCAIGCSGSARITLRV